jgi:hypothetical protein
MNQHISRYFIWRVSTEHTSYSSFAIVFWRLCCCLVEVDAVSSNLGGGGRVFFLGVGLQKRACALCFVPGLD